MFSLTKQPQKIDFTLEERKNLNFLNTQNALFRYIWKADYSAPVTELLHKGANVLDVG